MHKSKDDKDKTNVMRLLDSLSIPYRPHTYPKAEAVSGKEVASYLGENPDQVFKTLVTVGKSGDHYVFLVPSSRELDLKKAAKAAQEKSIEMIRDRELLPLTGYIHGGCSPIGMKKEWKTFVDETGKSLAHIMVSAGKIGYQIEISPDDLQKVTGAVFVPISK